MFFFLKFTTVDGDKGASSLFTVKAGISHTTNEDKCYNGYGKNIVPTLVRGDAGILNIRDNTVNMSESRKRSRCQGL